MSFDSANLDGRAPEGLRHRQIARRSFETHASARKCLKSAVSSEAPCATAVAAISGPAAGTSGSRYTRNNTPRARTPVARATASA